MSTSKEKQSTAGIIIIGDEILKGYTQDTNSLYLCQRLNMIGICVEKVSVIKDDVDTIAREIFTFSQRYTFVLTTGGIGPTHDDVTYAGAAKAFQDKLVVNMEINELLCDYQCQDQSCACALKMALVPESSNLHYVKNKKTGELWAYPIISIRNVYIFPGVPEYLQLAFEGLVDTFRSIHLSCVLEMYLNQNDDVGVVSVMSRATNLFKGQVAFSRISHEHRCYNAKILIESESKRKAHEAFAYIQNELPPGSVIYFQEDVIANAMEQVYSVVEYSAVNNLTIAVRIALNVLEDCFDQFSLPQICVSFNGGKDCTVLLHLVHAVKQKRFPLAEQLQALYIKCLDPFPEIEQFIEQTASRYQLKLYTQNGPIKNGLDKFVVENKNIRVVLMASRRTDPYMATVKHFQMTDVDWPQIMRINPLLDWDYHDVWMFLRQLCLPYCDLYNDGYSSIGNASNTLRNPSLRSSVRGLDTYHPAYLLQDPRTERDGRKKTTEMSGH